MQKKERLAIKNFARFKRVEVGMDPTQYPSITENRLLIVRDEVEETTKGGIILAQETKEEKEDTTSRATIVKMGAMVDEDGKPTRFHEYDLAPGKRIAFSKYSGTEFYWGGIEFLLIRVDEVQLVWDLELELEHDPQ